MEGRVTHETKPRQKHSKKAWDLGKEARESGKPRESCPYHPDQRPQVRAWEQGYDSVPSAGTVTGGIPLPDVRVALPGGVRVRIETITQVGHYIPIDVDIAPMIVHYAKKVPPCPACRCLRLSSGSPAAENHGTKNGSKTVSYRCRACGAWFKAPVVER